MKTKEKTIIKVTCPDGQELFYRTFKRACIGRNLSYNYLKRKKRPFLYKDFIFEEEILIF